MKGRAFKGTLAILFAGLCGACEVPGTRPVLAIEAAADVLGVLFLDLNGNEEFDQTDTGVTGWSVRLVGGNGAIVATTLSDTTGVFRFLEVPAGRVLVDVDRDRLADTLNLFGLSLGSELILGLGDTVLVSVGFSYPKVPLGSVDTVPLGRQIFVEGIGLNSVVTNGPRELHLRSEGDALRVTNVVRRAIGVGDSVRVRGRRASEAGQPVLTGAELFLIRSSVEDPEPLALTTGTTATAQGSVFGAELARIRSADLLAARNELNDVILTVDDGTGALEILLRSFLGADASFFHPDSVRIREATGLLIPFVDEAGETRWRLATRSSADLRVEAQPLGPGPAP